MEISSLFEGLQFPLPEAAQEQVHEQLEHHIRHLIHNNFNGLVHLLYMVDVDEQKLKQALQQQPEQDAAQLIAGLILTRQQQKAQQRQAFKTTATDVPDEERW